MAKNSAVNLDITPNADGYSIAGGVTPRTLTITAGNLTLSSGGANTYTFPAATGTLVSRDSTDTLTNKLLSTGTTFDNNIVPGTALATSAIKLGYAQITTTFSTASTSFVQVTSLTSTVTVPAGGRGVKITVFTRGLYTSLTATRAVVSIWDGTVGSGTQLAEGWGAGSGTAAANSGGCVAFVTPSAGSKTYNVGLRAEPSGTASMDCSSASPAFILVELI